MRLNTHHLIVALAFTCGLAAAAQQPPTPDRQQLIDKYIQQLGSKYFVKREEARKELQKFGEEALPALEKAAQGNDPEIQRRAEVLVGDLRDKVRARAMSQLQARVDAGSIDLFVEHLAAKGPGVTAEDWERFQKMTADLATRAGKALKFDLKNLPPGEPNGPAQLIRGKAVADAVTSTGIVEGAVAARGSVTVNANLIHTVIFATGDVTVAGQMVGCLVVSDGEVRINGDAIDSIIVARGKVKLNRPFGTVIAAGGVVKWNAKSVNSQVQEEQASPLEVTFFDPAQLGVVLAEADGKVVVEKVTAGTALAKAGLQKGDVVLALGKTPAATVEVCRAGLRRQLIEGRALLQVERGGQAVTLSGSLVD